MRSLSRPLTFWIAAAALLVVTAASGAPSPLYVVYQHRIGFSSSVLTAIFAIYVIALLAALLTVGSLSDFIGRRPVLLVALTLELISLALFLPADSVSWLLAARTVQGVATGATLGALGAMLVDAQGPGSQLGSLLNSVAPGVGLALGALGAGALVQFAPAPTTLVFVVLMVLVALVGVGIALAPETSVRAPGSGARALRSLQPQLQVHREARPVFFAAVPAFIASWAVGGLYLSLGGSLAGAVFGLDNHLIDGLVVAAMTGTGAAASVLLRRTQPDRAMAVGSTTLVLGLAVTALAIDRTSTAAFFTGTVIAGFGFGASFLGGFRSVLVRVHNDDRAATLAAILAVSYAAFSIPAVAAGLAASHFGLRDTSLVYIAGVIAVSLSAIYPAVQRAMHPVQHPAHRPAPECATTTAPASP